MFLDRCRCWSSSLQSLCMSSCRTCFSSRARLRNGPLPGRTRVSGRIPASWRSSSSRGPALADLLASLTSRIDAPKRYQVVDVRCATTSNIGKRRFSRGIRRDWEACLLIIFFSRSIYHNNDDGRGVTMGRQTVYGRCGVENGVLKTEARASSASHKRFVRGGDFEF
jgi:hypothetical protein